MATATTQLPNDEYAEARGEWQDRYADLAQGKRNWQFAALGFFLVAVMTSAIGIIQVRQVKRIPYLVQTDPTGAIVTTIPQSSASSKRTYCRGWRVVLMWAKPYRATWSNKLHLPAVCRLSSKPFSNTRNIGRVTAMPIMCKTRSRAHLKLIWPRLWAPCRER